MKVNEWLIEHEKDIKKLKNDLYAYDRVDIWSNTASRVPKVDRLEERQKEQFSRLIGDGFLSKNVPGFSTGRRISITYAIQAILDHLGLELELSEEHAVVKEKDV